MTAAENDRLRADIEKDLVNTARVPAVARSMSNGMLRADIENVLVDTAEVPVVARSISCGPCARLSSAASLPSVSTEKSTIEQLCKGGNGACTREHVVNRTDTWIHARPQHRYHRYQRQSYRTWPPSPVSTDLKTLEVLTNELQRAFTPR